MLFLMFISVLRRSVSHLRVLVLFFSNLCLSLLSVSLSQCYGPVPCLCSLFMFLVYWLIDRHVLQIIRTLCLITCQGGRISHWDGR